MVIPRAVLGFSQAVAFVGGVRNHHRGQGLYQGRLPLLRSGSPTKAFCAEGEHAMGYLGKERMTVAVRLFVPFILLLQPVFRSEY
jgi:hypothetical protein